MVEIETSNQEVKKYIIECRKNGYSDTEIIDNLRKSNWPDDVINKSLNEVNMTIHTENQSIPREENINDKQVQLNLEPTEQPNSEKKEEKPKKKFSGLAVIALLLSPVPFIGLGVAMSALDGIKKNKQTGSIIAILAVLINVAVIGFLLYMMFRIFTMPSENLSGFAKFINDKFNLIEVRIW